MIGKLWRKWRDRRETRARATLDALKVRYHTFRILLATHDRALARLERWARPWPRPRRPTN
jgi:pyruvate,water dikinase